MKSFIQTLKLTEPITPAEKPKTVSNQSQSKQNNANASADKNAFKSMLNKQVQDRQLENQRTQQRQAQNKVDAQQNQKANLTETPEVHRQLIDELATVAPSIKDVQQRSVELASNSNINRNSYSNEDLAIQKTPLETVQLAQNVFQDNGETAKAKIQKELATEFTDAKESLQHQSFAVKEVDLVTQQALAAMQQPVNQMQINPQGAVVQDEGSDSTIDVMLSQKLAADLRKKSMDKADFSKDLNVSLNDDSVVEDALIQTKTDGVSERMTNEKGLGKGQQFAQTFNQQMVQMHTKPRDTSIENQQFKVNHFPLDQAQSQNGLMGQISAQVAGTPSNMANINAQQVAATSQIYTPFDNRAGWNQAVNQRVMYMIGANEQSATLTLNPPDLGPLQVVINVNNEQADTTFFSDDPNVRQALEDGMADLRDKMNEAGITLGQANVNAGQQFQQHKQQDNAQGMASNRSNLTAEAIGNESQQENVRTQNGLVDTFA